MKKDIEKYFLDVIYNREQGFKAEAIRKTLFVLSKLYTSVVKLRAFFYKHGIFRKKTLGCMIISIGNITVGGTGKTPLVEMFARALSEGGRKVAVLSRGYKRRKRFSFMDLLKMKWREYVPSVVSDGQKLLMDSRDAGDEPYMLARNLKGTPVIVGKNRVKSGSYAIEKFGSDTLILDDGFQYLPLNRRLNIVLVDATNPFGNGHLLPRGILREPLSHLTRADIFFVTKARDVRTDDIKRRLKEVNPRAEAVECYYEPKHLVDMCSGKELSLDLLKDKKAVVVSAIADPEGFETLLERLGAKKAMVFRYPDHYRFTENDIEIIMNSAQKKADMIVTTEKDSVRFPARKSPAVPIVYLRVEVKIISGHGDFKDCVARLCNY